MLGEIWFGTHSVNLQRRLLVGEGLLSGKAFLKGLPAAGSTCPRRAQLFQTKPFSNSAVRSALHVAEPAMAAGNGCPVTDHGYQSRASEEAPALEAVGPEQRVAPLRTELRALFQAALQAAYPGVEAQALVVASQLPQFADYQCNNAMALFGRLKGQEGAPKNPRAVAEAIIANLPQNDIVEGAPAVAGAGFVNVRVSPRWMEARLLQLLRQGIGTWAPVMPCARAVVDFSSPNVAKEMHVGHLRSTIIGDTLSRLLEYCGVRVVRINHVGDWGTQFGMLIRYMFDRNEANGRPGAVDEDVKDLQVLYKEAKARFDEDEDFKTRARAAVTQLQAGEASHVAAWERICEASRREFDAIYKRLGVQITERGESFYNPLLGPLVQELLERGIAEDSDGAKVVWVEGYKNPLIIQKSDGGFGYGTTDMAALRQRVEEEKGDWLIYVVDAGQGSHFDLVFGAGRKAGILQDARPKRVEHVGFGLVLGQDGKRIRTRAGGPAVRLVELLDEARDRCRETIMEKRGSEMEAEEVEHAAAAMGYGAVKYADLKNHRTTDYKFNMEDMLDLKGNTAVYLLYAHARIAAIGRKSGKDVAALVGSASISLQHEKEVALALHLLRFPEAVEEALADLAPNRITDYVYNLSEKFSGFYTECKVVGDEKEDSRLLLCEATAVVMRACFYLLGITPLYRI